MTSERVRTQVFPDTYRDSVDLMRIAAEVERLAGVPPGRAGRRALTRGPWGGLLRDRARGR